MPKAVRGDELYDVIQRNFYLFVLWVIRKSGGALVQRYAC